MTSDARQLIDSTLEALLEIYCDEIGLGSRTEFNTDPDSSYQNVVDVRKYLEKSSTVKKSVVSIAVKMWDCTADLHKLAKDQRDELDDLKTQLLESQRTVIKLQNQKLQENSETVHEMKEVVKAELKSYSSVTSSGTPAVTVPITPTAQLRQVVKSTVEEEERSRNVVVFGLREDYESEESTEDLVAEVCDKVGEKPRILSCLRLGLKKEGACRPILVSLASATAAQQLLYRAKELRDWEKHGKVYIGPDRSKEERFSRRELVERLKKLRVDEPGKTFVIRGDRVVLKSQ